MEYYGISWNTVVDHRIMEYGGLQNLTSDLTRGKNHALTVKTHMKLRNVARNFVESWTRPCVLRRNSQISRIEPLDPNRHQRGPEVCRRYAGNAKWEI